MALKTDTKFKLILGLGNKDTKGALETALLYARAGVRFFDTSPEIFPDFKKILIKNGFALNEFTFCVSVPSLGDIHGRTAKISETVCSNCGLCAQNCDLNAIFKDKKTQKCAVDEKKCIGCGICKKITECYAISFEYGNEEMETLKNLVQSNNAPDMVELHCSVDSKAQIINDFKDILTFFKGDISVCINKKQFPINSTVALLKELQKILAETSPEAEFFVQADGASMNGGSAEKDSSLECVTFAKELEPHGFKLIISGGTNLETPEITKEYGINPIIAYGSFARKIVLEETQNQALIKARELFVKTEGEKELLK